MTTPNHKDTLNLPQTDYPMRANLATAEPERLALWQKEGFYEKMRAARKGAKPFVLHCGPPYANGALHAGHLIPSLLKDMVVRSKFMAGFDTPYIPGWDCHGLPLEWKVEEELRAEGKTKDSLSPSAFRDLCREKALHWIGIQKETWQRMGAVGDWANPYLTMNFKNEADLVRLFGNLMQTGLLYKGFKPVMWSTVEETALAEAEIEYEDHESTAVYVKFPVLGHDNTFVVAWTTTPWTLPANRAIAYGDDISYVLVRPTKVHEKATAQTTESYWLAEELLPAALKMLGIEAHDVVTTQKGAAFKGWQCAQVLYSTPVPMLAGDHVTTEAGTGFVHTAPAHGLEDFIVGQAAGLDLACPVLGNGAYDKDVAALPTTGVALAGVNIWNAQALIVKELEASSRLLRWHKLKHSYPMSWRSHKPLIYRTTEQWFMAMDKTAVGQTDTLRNTALSEIGKVRWVPDYGSRRIGSMIENRPDWCLSRQRLWGVPIALFWNTKTNSYITDPAVFESIAKMVEEKGVNAWSDCTTDELLPAGWCKANNVTADDLVKESGILDVWYDSGGSFFHVLKQRDGHENPADMYLEGSDQHRGWFHSSLLLSVAAEGHAPYRQVLTHGFVVDANGRKMSKSKGNGAAAGELIGKYGADLMRLWVAASDYTDDIVFSDEIMKGVTEVYRRLRNTIRYLIGNLSDFNAATDKVAYADLPPLEKLVLARFSSTLATVRDEFSNYRFYRCYHLLQNLCAGDLSSIYFDIRKDRLYCDGPASQNRRACQTVLHEILTGILTHLMPMMPFTADEAWRLAFGQDKPLYVERFSEGDPAWRDAALLADWDKLMEIRALINGVIEKDARAAGWAGTNGDVKVALTLPPELMPLATAYDIEELCMVAGLTVTAGEALSAIVAKADGEKCPRCWNFDALSASSGLCPRCDSVLSCSAAA